MAIVRVTKPDGTLVFDYPIEIGHISGPGPIPEDYFRVARENVEEDNLVADDEVPLLKYELLP